MPALRYFPLYFFAPLIAIIDISICRHILPRMRYADAAAFALSPLLTLFDMSAAVDVAIYGDAAAIPLFTHMLIDCCHYATLYAADLLRHSLRQRYGFFVAITLFAA